jgi:hypothetical protein
MAWILINYAQGQLYLYLLMNDVVERVTNSTQGDNIEKDRV